MADLETSLSASDSFGISIGPSSGTRLSTAASQQLHSSDEFEDPAVSESTLKSPLEMNAQREDYRRQRSFSDDKGNTTTMSLSELFHQDTSLLPTQDKSSWLQNANLHIADNLSKPEPYGDQVLSREATVSDYGSSSQAKSQSNANSVSAMTKEDRKQRRRMLRSQSEGVATMRSSIGNESPISPRQTLLTVKEDEPESAKLETLSKLTQLRTSDLPEIPEFGQKVRPKRERKSRFKSVSDGVALMRTVDVDYPAKQDLVDDTLLKKPSLINVSSSGSTAISAHERKQMRRRNLAKTQSEGVAFMRSSLSGGAQRPANKNTLSTEMVNETSKLETLSELVQMKAEVSSFFLCALFRCSFVILMCMIVLFRTCLRFQLSSKPLQCLKDRDDLA